MYYKINIDGEFALQKAGFQEALSEFLNKQQERIADAALKTIISELHQNAANNPKEFFGGFGDDHNAMLERHEFIRKAIALLAGSLEHGFISREDLQDILDEEMLDVRV